MQDSLGLHFSDALDEVGKIAGRLVAPFIDTVRVRSSEFLAKDVGKHGAGGFAAIDQDSHLVRLEFLPGETSQNLRLKCQTRVDREDILAQQLRRKFSEANQRRLIRLHRSLQPAHVAEVRTPQQSRDPVYRDE